MKTFLITVISSVLTATAWAQAPDMGSLLLKVEPEDGVQVFVDGQFQTNAVPVLLRLPAGLRQIVVKSAQGERTESLSIPKDAVVTKIINLMPLEPSVVIISGGSFRMGSPATQVGRSVDEGPAAMIVEPFYIGRYEVTSDEYDAFARDTGRTPPGDSGWGRGSRPVINVSFDDATAYTEWLSRKTGRRYRLPTEAEWERAAQGGADTAYWWGNLPELGDANCADCVSQWDGKQTAPVGSFSANQFGLFDVHSNVWEWTCSAYEIRYLGANTCTDGKNSTNRVLKGGSYGDPASVMRSATRNGAVDRNQRYPNVGFRVVREP